MHSEQLTAAGFAVASLVTLAGSWALRGTGPAQWIAVIAAVLLGLSAIVLVFKCRYIALDRTKISAVTVSKAPFRREPRVRGKSPPPRQ